MILVTRIYEKDFEFFTEIHSTEGLDNSVIDLVRTQFYWDTYPNISPLKESLESHNIFIWDTFRRYVREKNKNVS